MTHLSDLTPAYITGNANVIANQLPEGVIAYGADGKLSADSRAAVTFVDGTVLKSHTSGGTLTPAKPVGMVEGDMIIMLQISRNSICGEPDVGGDWQKLFGYTVASTSISETESTDDICRLWWKFATASEPATYDVLISSDSGIDSQTIHTMAFRNAKIIQFYDAKNVGTNPRMWGFINSLQLIFHGVAYETSDESTVAVPAGGYTLISKEYEITNLSGMATAYKALTADGYIAAANWTTSWESYDITGCVILQ